ncbi:hypothetical protein SLA2020_394840 [Shorea laevis]
MKITVVMHRRKFLKKISTNRKNSQRKELTQQTQSKNTEANSIKEKAEEDDGVDSFWKSNSRRRKIRSCKSVYQISSMAGIKSRSSKKGGRASTKKNRKEKLPNFIPNRRTLLQVGLFQTDVS